MNDWRALGIFSLAIMLVMMGLCVWLVIMLVRANKPVIDTIIPIRMAMEAAAAALVGVRSELSALIGQVATLTSAVGQNGDEAKEANRKLEVMAAEIERLKRERLE